VAPKKKMTGRTASAHLSRNVHLARGPDSFNLIIDQEKINITKRNKLGVQLQKRDWK
jgi:hypothetical protein